MLKRVWGLINQKKEGLFEKVGGGGGGWRGHNRGFTVSGEPTHPGRSGNCFLSPEGFSLA